jgi:hypothetical protein
MQRSGFEPPVPSPAMEYGTKDLWVIWMKVLSDEVLMVKSMKVWPQICPIPAPGVCLRTYDTPRSSSQNSRTHWRFLLNGLLGSGPWRISQVLLVLWIDFLEFCRIVTKLKTFSSLNLGLKPVFQDPDPDLSAGFGIVNSISGYGSNLDNLQLIDQIHIRPSLRNF